MPKATPVEETLTDLCKICERVPWGEVVRLGFRKWRHVTCSIGSEEWKLYYLRLPLADRTKLQGFYNSHYEGGA